MGLDTSHDCWSGTYSSFSTWRKEIAKAADYPPYDLMRGFMSASDVAQITYWTMLAKESACCEKSAFAGSVRVAMLLADSVARLPISWEPFRHDVLSVLLDHSDCDGHIEHKHCADLALRLEGLLPKLSDSWIRACTERFVKGLRAAAAAGENVEFH